MISVANPLLECISTRNGSRIQMTYSKYVTKQGSTSHDKKIQGRSVDYSRPHKERDNIFRDSCLTVVCLLRTNVAFSCVGGSRFWLRLRCLTACQPLLPPTQNSSRLKTHWMCNFIIRTGSRACRQDQAQVIRRNSISLTSQSFYEDNARHILSERSEDRKLIALISGNGQRPPWLSNIACWNVGFCTPPDSEGTPMNIREWDCRLNKVLVRLAG